MRWGAKLRSGGGRLRAAAMTLCVVLGAVAAAGTAHAQSAADERSIDEMRTVKNDARRKEQKEAIQRIKDFAAKSVKARGLPADGPDYWAIVQANLANSRAAAIEKAERSLAEVTRADTLPDAAQVEAMRDAGKRKALEKQVKDLEDGERIFGGAPAQISEFLEVVALAWPDPATESGISAFCTGTLIAGDTVLTAAHCICDGPFGEQPSALVVVGNDANRNAGIVAAFKATNGLLLHREYCDIYRDPARKKELPRDIAIVKFDAATPVKGAVPQEGLRIARIAGWQFLFSEQPAELQIVGFGWTEDKKLGEKRFAFAPVAETVCRTGSTYGCLEGTEIVAVDGAKKRDTCQGDSGGPAFVVERRRFLAAVTSRGGECGTGGIYSLITPSVLEWLNSDLGIDPIVCPAPGRCLQQVK